MADDFGYHIDHHGRFAQVADQPLMSEPEQRAKLQLVEVVARYYWGNEI
jgi:hypothetical protein